MSFTYRKKPVVIEAIQLQDGMFSDTTIAYPSWLIAALVIGTVYVSGKNLVIRTLEGEMTASPNDWIIQGVKGELYPCKPDIFDSLYDKVDDLASVGIATVNRGAEIASNGITAAADTAKGIFQTIRGKLR